MIHLLSCILPSHMGRGDDRLGWYRVALPGAQKGNGNSREWCIHYYPDFEVIRARKLGFPNALRDGAQGGGGND